MVIYIATENPFLMVGIKNLLNAQVVSLLDHQSIDLNIFGRITIDDIVIIDMCSYLDEVISQLNTLPANMTVIILKHDNYLRVNFLTVPHYTLNTKISCNLFKTFMSTIQPIRKELNQHVASLSPREKQVIDLSMDGASVESIACIIGISLKMVYYYRKKACRKLGVEKISSLVRLQRSSTFKSWVSRSAIEQTGRWIS
ncbi:helix-turn-helix transcriptional regulator (plasmid) [Enterobacter asburiae]|jgi:DNA-binding CsgD family transcriptional regulator|uniref:helix-turn-helix transcriptional regulator n=1 Tax=Enterobacter asburiae TaxID=61645 RepID=UPI002932560B|nr:helix-turn-helix transcriptional regulator [Enterobacter asburiae]EMA4739884.1 helix-turn-helix transcriptional regulator [Enterobacter asburiae]